MRKWEVRVFLTNAYDTDWIEIFRCSDYKPDPNEGIDTDNEVYVEPGSEEFFDVVEEIIYDGLQPYLDEIPEDVLEEFISKVKKWWPWTTMQPALGYVEEEGEHGGV